MSSLYFMETEDFYIKESKMGDGTVLCNRIQGMSVCFFYSTNCPYSKQLLPIIKNMRINNVQIGLVNINTQRELVRISQSTKSPIRFTPVITMYYNGIPCCNFDNSKPMNEHTISQFIVQVGAHIREKIVAQEYLNKKTQKNYQHPAYSYGIPLIGDDLDNVTYIKWDEFMNKAENHRR